MARWVAYFTKEKGCDSLAVSTIVWTAWSCIWSHCLQTQLAMLPSL